MRGGLALGLSTLWLSLIVLIPLASVVVKATGASFWSVVTSPRAIAALELSVGVSLATPAVNAVAGTQIAGVLVRDVSTGPGLAGWLRVNAGTEDETTAFLEALAVVAQQDEAQTVGQDEEGEL